MSLLQVGYFISQIVQRIILTPTLAFTLHTDPAMKTMWRINVPQLGFQNDFVMRGILALSALHMARYKPEKRDFYMSQAIMQHQAG